MGIHQHCFISVLKVLNLLFADHMYSQCGVSKTPRSSAHSQGREDDHAWFYKTIFKRVAGSEHLPGFGFLFDADFRNNGLFNEIFLMNSGPQGTAQVVRCLLSKDKDPALIPRPV